MKLLEIKKKPLANWFTKNSPHNPKSGRALTGFVDSMHYVVLTAPDSLQFDHLHDGMEAGAKIIVHMMNGKRHIPDKEFPDTPAGYAEAKAYAQAQYDALQQ